MLGPPISIQARSFLFGGSAVAKIEIIRKMHPSQHSAPALYGDTLNPIFQNNKGTDTLLKCEKLGFLPGSDWVKTADNLKSSYCIGFLITQEMLDTRQPVK